MVPYWNIPQISYGARSPTLSDRNKFPLFFRTVAPDSSHNIAKIQFIKYFGWQVVAAFSESKNTYLLPINRLVKELENENITCIGTITFSIDNYKEQLRTLKDLDIRIILASFSVAVASQIFCEVHKLQMYGSDYVWILQRHHQDKLWWLQQSPSPSPNIIESVLRRNNYCEADQLKGTIEGLILVSDVDTFQDNETSVSDSGLRVDEFKSELDSASNSSVISELVYHVYDAIWAIAFALKGNGLITCSNSRYNYHRRGLMVEDFVKKMQNLKFLGLSGPLQFYGSDRIGDSTISQIQDGEIVKIAHYESSKNKVNFNCRKCGNISWKNGKIPVAQRIVKPVIIKIPLILYYFVCVLSILGICCSLLFLFFSLKFRRVRNLKLFSPKLNNVAVLGCILVYSSVILMEIDKLTESTGKFYALLCTTKAYLLSAGFSLVYGSIFAKTYRVHKLFNNCRTSVLKTKFLKDTHLIALISIPILIDAGIFALWVFIDPMEKKLHNLTLEYSIRSGIVYQNQVEICGSNSTIGWYFALYGYKGLVIIMAVFMSWENRHVKIPTLNDLQYIGICVYSVMFTGIMLILSNFIAQYVILSYLSSSCSILLTTSLTLILLFLPQVKMIFNSMENDDYIMQSLGLKFECNTRRLIHKDHKELITRLEIQNRVFKCEIKDLDEKIKFLENLLNKSSTASSSSAAFDDIVFTITKPYCMDVPEVSYGRASWPASCSQSAISGPLFVSENKLNEHFFDRFRLFGKLKKFFGSISILNDANSGVEIDPKFRVGVKEEVESVISLEIGGTN